MQKTQIHDPIEGEFVTGVAPPQPATWQQRSNGVGYTFRADLKQMEGRVEEQFTQLHQHLVHRQTLQQAAMTQCFTTLDGRLMQTLLALDSKVTALLAKQRSRSSRRITLGLMGLVLVLGVYITVLHPLLRPAQPVVSPLPSSPAPIVPLPQDIQPQN